MDDDDNDYCNGTTTTSTTSNNDIDYHNDNKNLTNTLTTIIILLTTIRIMNKEEWRKRQKIKKNRENQRAKIKHTTKTKTIREIINENFKWINKQVDRLTD